MHLTLVVHIMVFPGVDIRSEILYACARPSLLNKLVFPCKHIDILYCSVSYFHTVVHRYVLLFMVEVLLEHMSDSSEPFSY